MANDSARTFTLVGKFDDGISPQLKKINKEIADLGKAFEKSFEVSSKAAQKLSSSLEDTTRATGKLSSTISGLSNDAKSISALGRAFDDMGASAGRTGSAIEGIGRSAQNANRETEGLLKTLLKAEGLSRLGDAMAQGFQRSVGVMAGTARKAAGVFAKAIKEAAQDEMADIKAASGMQGSFTLAGYSGDFKDAQRMYRAYDRQVSEMIRQSAAPTAKVVELQRYTLDTMGPLMLAAQGVAKGTKMKDIDPKKIQTAATQYGKFLEKVAILGQGTGSAGFRVAAGVEQLVTRGKIDTTIDFFTDNILLMKQLEKAGFAGRGARSSKLMSAGVTDAQRMKAMMDAFAQAMSGEATAAMASSITGSLQGLQDTIFNPSVGILGMATTFTKGTQKAVNQQIVKVQNARIARYEEELKSVQVGSSREKQLRISIEQAQKTRDQLVKEGEERITNPFQAFSYAFGNLVRGLTEALNAIGPVWETFAPAMIEFTDRVLGPLTETLKNVASDIRGKKVTQMEGFGRIIGEVFKTVGQIMGDIANMISSPTGAMGQMQSEFMKGFMAAFKEPGSLDKAKRQLSEGISALVSKLFSVIVQAITFEPIRPFVLLFFAAMFGPALIGAVIAGATPLIITAIGEMVVGTLTRGGVRGAAGRTGGSIASRMAPLFLGSKGAEAAQALNSSVKQQTRLLSTRSKGLFQQQYTSPIGPVMAGFQRPGGRVIMESELTGMAKFMSGLSKFAKVATKLGESLPLVNIAFGILDFGLRKAAGEKTGRAAGGAIGAGAGGVAGAVLGSALGPAGTVAGGFLGAWLGDWLGSNLGGMLDGLGPRLSGVWSGLTNWFQNLPANLGYALGSALANMESAWKRFVQWWNNLGAEFKTAVSRLGWQFKAAWEGFKKVVSQILSGKFDWGGLASRLSNTIWNIVKSGIDGVRNLASGIGNWFSGFGRGMEQGYRETRGGYRSTETQQRQSKSSLNPLFQVRATGGLGDAIAQELRMKPPGSDLVIANSSETIIPAARGLGMRDFMETLTTGFSAVKQLFRDTQAETRLKFQAVNTLLDRSRQETSTNFRGVNSRLDRSSQEARQNQTQNNSRFTAIDKRLEKLTSGGLFGSGGPGNIIGVGKALLGMGLQVGMNPYFEYGKGFLPGGGGYIGKHTAGSYHYLGRALDVSGPPGLLDVAYQRLKATNPTELLWRVKDHYDHLHVAYALGQGMPAFFSSRKDAVDWERKATLGNVRVSSITSNSSEGFGGGVTVNAPITINQQPGQNAEHLAALVAMELSNAINQARSSSLYV